MKIILSDSGDRGVDLVAEKPDQIAELIKNADGFIEGRNFGDLRLRIYNEVGTVTFHFGAAYKEMGRPLSHLIPIYLNTLSPNEVWGIPDQKNLNEPTHIIERDFGDGTD